MRPYIWHEVGERLFVVTLSHAAMVDEGMARIEYDEKIFDDLKLRHNGNQQ